MGDAGNVQLWSAERPEMYCLLLELKDAYGNTCCIEASQLGFRQTVVSDGVLLHNGRRIMLRGVNRHEHDAIDGKVPPFLSTF
jgi:beta-galactosidase